MVNLDDHTIRFINLQVDDNYHFFGIAIYFEDFYFTDIPSDGVYAAEFPIGLVQLLNLRLRTPTEIHIYAGMFHCLLSQSYLVHDLSLYNVVSYDLPSNSISYDVIGHSYLSNFCLSFREKVL